LSRPSHPEYSAADYLIINTGATYIAEPRYGLTYLSDSSLHDLWDLIYGEVTSPVIEFTRGSFEVDGELDIQADDTVVRGQGPQATELKLGDGVDTNVFAQNTYHHNIYIGDLTIHGNRDNNTVGNGIDFNPGACTYAGTSQYWGWVHINNIQICEMDEAAIYLRSTSGTHVQSAINGFRIHDNDGDSSGYDIALLRLWDLWVGGGGQNNCADIRCSGVTTSIFDNIYFGVASSANLSVQGASDGLLFNGCRFDNSTAHAVEIIDTTSRCTFNGCTMTNFNQSGTTDTHACISLEDTTSYNNFLNCFMGHTKITGDRWTYVVDEIDTSDYNKFIGCVSGYGAIDGGNAEHFTQNEYSINGNTTIANCYKDNGAAWNA